MDVPIKEDAETTIECEYGKLESKSFGGKNFKPRPGTYHYKAYVPPGYKDTPDLQRPCLFIFSPGGAAEMSSVRDRLRREGWIVVMLVEAKNGPEEPILGNFLAAHDDAVQRLRVQEGLKFATGVSGGARASSQCICWREGFAGIILQVAGFWYTDNGSYQYAGVQQHKDLVVFGLFGDTDMNLSEAEQTQRQLPAHTRYRYEVFPGGHIPAPVKYMDHAFDWIEDRVYLETTMPKNAQFWVTRKNARHWYLHVLSQRLKAAEKLEVGILQYEALDWLLKFSAKHSLAQMDKEARENEDAARKQMAELKKSAELGKEIAAQQAFRKLVLAEATERAKKQGKKQASQGLFKLYQDFTALAKKHDGTEYAHRAQERAEDLQTEIEAQKKPGIGEKP